LNNYSEKKKKKTSKKKLPSFYSEVPKTLEVGTTMPTPENRASNIIDKMEKRKPDAEMMVIIKNDKDEIVQKHTAPEFMKIMKSGVSDFAADAVKKYNDTHGKANKQKAELEVHKDGKKLV